MKGAACQSGPLLALVAQSLQLAFVLYSFSHFLRQKKEFEGLFTDESFH